MKHAKPDLELFLKASDYCDIRHYELNQLASKVAGDLNSDSEVAVELFYWVRDNILYKVGDWKHSASETLKLGEGTCTNKANLLVALLRIKNIPAGYGVLKVKGEKYFGPLVTGVFQRFINKESTHVYAVAYLMGRWVKCDPSDDLKLSESTSHVNYTTKIVDWDGIRDAVLDLKNDHILSDEFPINNIDFIMEKYKFRFIKSIGINFGNLYIKYLRKNGKKYDNIEMLESDFFKYAFKKHLFATLLFLIAVKFYNAR